MGIYNNIIELANGTKPITDVKDIGWWLDIASRNGLYDGIEEPLTSTWACYIAIGGETDSSYIHPAKIKSIQLPQVPEIQIEFLGNPGFGKAPRLAVAQRPNTSNLVIQLEDDIENITLQRVQQLTAQSQVLIDAKDHWVDRGVVPVLSYTISDKTPNSRFHTNYNIIPEISIFMYRYSTPNDTNYSDTKLSPVFRFRVQGSFIINSKEILDLNADGNDIQMIEMELGWANLLCDRFLNDDQDKPGNDKKIVGDIIGADQIVSPDHVISSNNTGIIREDYAKYTTTAFDQDLKDSEKSTKESIRQKIKEMKKDSEPVFSLEKKQTNQTKSTSIGSFKPLNDSSVKSINEKWKQNAADKSIELKSEFSLLSPIESTNQIGNELATKLQDSVGEYVTDAGTIAAASLLNVGNQAIGEISSGVIGEVERAMTDIPAQVIKKLDMRDVGNTLGKALNQVYSTDVNTRAENKLLNEIKTYAPEFYDNELVNSVRQFKVRDMYSMVAMQVYVDIRKRMTPVDIVTDPNKALNIALDRTKSILTKSGMQVSFKNEQSLRSKTGVEAYKSLVDLVTANGQLTKAGLNPIPLDMYDVGKAGLKYLNKTYNPFAD